MDFNILTPEVTRSHATLGATYSLENEREVDVSYIHAFKDGIKGASGFGLGTIEHKMNQNVLSINLSQKF